MNDSNFIVYSPENKPKAIDNNTKIIKIDSENCIELQQLYATLKLNLGFDNSFGNNLDALYDAMTDLNSVKESKIWIIFSNTNSWLETESADRVLDLLDLLNDAASTINSEPLFGNESKELIFYFEQSSRIESILNDSFLIWGHIS